MKGLKISPAFSSEAKRRQNETDYYTFTANHLYNYFIFVILYTKTTDVEGCLRGYVPPTKKLIIVDNLRVGDEKTKKQKKTT